MISSDDFFLETCIRLKHTMYAVLGPLRKYLSTSLRAAEILVLETLVYHLRTEKREKETNLPLSSSRPKMAEHILCRGNLFANWSTTGPAEGSSESEQVASYAQGRLRLVRKIVWIVGRFAMASRSFSNSNRALPLSMFLRTS